MIPVALQPEPSDFDVKVRQPGRCYLQQHPTGDLPPYWQTMTQELWKVYGGICAYLAVFFEFATGAASTDHFVAKSQERSLAYEWSNYRLASLAMNRRKGIHEVLDPCEIEANSFFINFLDGEIYPNPEKTEDYRISCQKTIDVLQLNDAPCKRMRLEHFQEFAEGNVSLSYLKQKSPFVFQKVIRQKLT